MAGLSLVVLGGTALDIDPETLVILSGKRRGSVHKLIGGDTLIQDFGINVGDMMISFSGMLTDIATLQALMTLYRLTGGIHTYTDFKDNEFTVAFEPGEESFQAEPNRGSTVSFKYTIKLRVVTVTQYLGVSLPPQS